MNGFLMLCGCSGWPRYISSALATLYASRWSCLALSNGTSENARLLPDPPAIELDVKSKVGLKPPPYARDDSSGPPNAGSYIPVSFILLLPDGVGDPKVTR